MRYAVPLITLLIATMSFGANAEVISGSMDCTIKGQTIETIVEGVSKSYPSIQNEAKVGDKLSLSYLTAFNGWELRLFDKNNNGEFSLGFFEEQRDESFQKIIFRSQSSFVSINTNEVFSKVVNDTLHLRRYYKGDWNGILTQIGVGEADLYTKIIAIDCKSVEDRFSEAVRKLQKR